MHSIITNDLDKYAPVRQRRVKSLHLPEWYTPEIGQSRETRDKLKHSNNWTEYKRFRNKTSKLNKTAKRKHFTDSIENSKDTKLIWKHLRTINDPASTKNRILPDELEVNNETISDLRQIAAKLNDYFSSIAHILNKTNTETRDPDLSKLNEFVNSRVPDTVTFKIPYIRNDQVLSNISALGPSKATSLDGLGPKSLKRAASIIAHLSLLLLIKAFQMERFPVR